MTVATASSTALGATWTGESTRFAVFSERASELWLCLFDAGDPGRELSRHAMAPGDHGVWRLELPGVGPDQLYGYRAAGDFAPERGHRFNPAKLLFDPHARSYAGELRWGPALYEEAGGSRRSALDSGPFVPKSQVADPTFDWQDDRRPAIDWADTVIYEAHVRGLTRLHPEVPPPARGTFAGLAHPAVVEHLLSLGVSAVELLPVAFSLSEHWLTEVGLSNYWGYNPLGLFAPDRRFASGDDPVREFKSMVRALHAAGLEVILDVVLNHTAEGNEKGPTLCFKGLDNVAYYRLERGDAARYEDFSGCGNTLDVRHDCVLGLALDVLRFWAGEMRVDGFRFDLAPTLGRAGRDFDPAAPFFAAVAADPLLARLKLVAEPWDLGPGGYRLGRFPPGWTQWNDRYRDTVRSFWRADQSRVSELATRLTGSSDLFPTPAQSVNMVACHDGFTLHDLASYEVRHNLANREHGRDGHGHNLSRNWGVEGPTGDATILELRRRARRNLLATLAFSRGVPLLGHGDEIGRTQQGNNNAYCQDNEISWVDWRLDDERLEFLAFTREALALRRRYPLLRRAAFLVAGTLDGEDSVHWLAPDGSEMTRQRWHDPASLTLAALLSEGSKLPHRQQLLLLLNAGDEPCTFTLPTPCDGARWTPRLDTGRYPELGTCEKVAEKTLAGQASGSSLVALAHSLILLAADLPAGPEGA